MSWELHPCQRKTHYGEACDCEARLALVVTHTRTSTPLGPDYCAECSEAISEWVPWPCDATREARDVWDGAVLPGGYVCSLCGWPSESEPCEHLTEGGE